jgi:hypothetical protein
MRAANRRAESATPSLDMLPPIRRSSIEERPLVGSSRASSTISTRSKKPRLERGDSATPSIDGGSDLQAQASQNINEDQVVDITTEVTDANAPPRRGRPKKGEGRGRGKGGGRGGKAVEPSRQNSQDLEPTKPTARGGRGRRTSSNRMVQAAYDRQLHLKKSYREVARLVRLGLDAIAEKNLDMIEEDPTFYRRLPECQQVLDGLDAAETSALSKEERRRQVHEEYLKRKLELANDYDQQIFQVSIPFSLIEIS